MKVLQGGLAQVPSIAEIRARAEAHEQELDLRVRYLTIQQVADRFGLSVKTIWRKPWEELRYIEEGNGAQRKRRRYHPRDVAAYEARHGVGGHAA